MREFLAVIHTIIFIFFLSNMIESDVLFFQDLCAAYFDEGNDMYVELTPEYVDAGNFLLEAGLITHHPYDKERVRLVDLWSILTM